ncbi:hypothetical protein FSB84_24365 [Pseudobacter ginsenosidimutans]|uniref:hypothetical protein n=1 Tax=Pseudobacter ginsenosidimutans TaxID=661488 RepID=UPI0011BBD288|nr:hypothetical protein [Pseudobacter ginsenosidimutans]QEC44660.1 hypothetical protein FSB84_24365 [Pseudobacter ginsenosidimutans]
MKTKIILSCLLYLGCVSTGFTQSACTSGKLDSNAKKVLPFMPDLSLQQERDMPVAVRRNQSPPDLNPVPESKMQRIRITADSIPVIVFRPDHPVGKMPVIVDFHGGAFVYPCSPGCITGVMSWPIRTAPLYLL